MKQVDLIFCFSDGEFFTLRGDKEDIEELFDAVARHVRNHGFSGWYRYESNVINMTDVQVFYVKFPPDDENPYGVNNPAGLVGASQVSATENALAQNQINGVR